MDKQYEIWVDWNAYTPAYTCSDLDEALTVFAGAVKMCRPGERVEIRVVPSGTVIAAAPVEEPVEESR